MRSKEELKKLFLKQAEYILDNYMDKLNELANSIPNNEESSKEQYNNFLGIASSLRNQDNITDEEFEVIKENMIDWQHELLPMIINRITIN
jgi:hypothetical protein